MNARDLLRELLQRAGIHVSRHPPPVTTEFHSELRRLLLGEDVEPVPSFYADLASVARRDPRWTAHQVTLGSTPTTSEIRVTRGPRMSSFREASEVGEE